VGSTDLLTSQSLARVLGIRYMRYSLRSITERASGRLELETLQQCQQVYTDSTMKIRFANSIIKVALRKKSRPLELYYYSHTPLFRGFWDEKIRSQKPRNRGDREIRGQLIFTVMT